jgi:hypothetical protein
MPAGCGTPTPLAPVAQLRTFLPRPVLSEDAMDPELDFGLLDDVLPVAGTEPGLAAASRRSSSASPPSTALCGSAAPTTSSQLKARPPT